MIDILTEENFLLFCASHYDNSHYATTEDFLEDVNRIKYIKKLVTRYIENGDLKERLILNHIIILYNCFGAEVCCRLLYFKLKHQMRYIKPFLILLNIMPNQLYNVGEDIVVDTDLIDMDPFIVSKLRKV